MYTLINAVIQRPWLTALLLAVVTGLALAQLDRLTVRISADQLMLAEDPERRLQETVRELFGESEAIVVFVEDNVPLTAAKLQSLRDVVTELERLPGVSRVDSLFSARNLKWTEAGVERAYFEPPRPTNLAELQTLLRDLQAHPFARHLLSADATATMIVVYAAPDFADPQADAGLIAAIEEAIAPLRKVVAFAAVERSFTRVHTVGAPYVRDAIARAVVDGRYLLLLLALGAVALAVLLRVRSLSAVLLPPLIGGLSAVWLWGFMAVTGLPVNALTALAPVLVAILGSAQYIQLLSLYGDASVGQGSTAEALRLTAQRSGLTFFIAFLTAVAGVAALALHEIRVLQQFSAALTVGMLIHLLITVTVVPLWLLAFGGLPQPKEQKTGPGYYHRAINLLARAASFNTVAVLSLAVSVMLVLGSGIFFLQSDNNPAAYLGSQAPLQQHNRRIAERLHGPQSFDLVFSAHRGAFKNPELLREIVKVQEYIEQIGLFDFTQSLADLLAFARRVSDQAGSGGSLPDSDGQVEAYLGQFYDRYDLAPYVAPDYSRALVRVWHHLSNSYQMAQALAKLTEFTDTLDPRLEVHVSGESVRIDAAAGRLFSGLLWSWGALLAGVFIAVSVLFLNIRAGLVVVLPAIFVTLLLFGTMGYLGIPLNVWTVVIAAVTTVVAIGHTLHLMIQHNEEARVAASEREAMQRTIRAELPLIVTTGAALMLGFAVMLSAELAPVNQLGGLAALATLVTLLANLIIAPKLLSSMRYVTLWGMVNVNVAQSVVERCALFEGMRAWQIKQVILMSQVRRVDAGEMLIREGDVDREMYVILSGDARVLKDQGRGVETIYHAVPGDVLGEVALVAQLPRTASVVANSELELLVLEWSTLERLGQFLPMVSSRLFLNIARIIGKRMVN